MVSHIFGTQNSPSCANYCLKRTADDNKKIFSEEAVNSFFTKDLLVIISGSFEAVVCAARRILRAKNVRDQLVLLGAYGSQRLPTIRNRGRQHPLQVLSPGGT